MDLQVENLRLRFFSLCFRESIFILRSSPYPFALITLTFILPLSFAIFAHTLVTQPPFLHLHLFSTFFQLSFFLIYQFAYLIVLFTVTLSISVIVFSVSSFYTSKPIAFLSTTTSIQLIFPRLFKTFLCVSAIMLLYYTTFFMSISALLVLVPPSQCSHLFFFTRIIIVLLFIIVYISMSALWHLASVVSILESARVFRVTKNSHEFLRGMMEMVSEFFVAYVVVCVAIVEAFKAVIVKGPEEEGDLGIGSGPKILIGGVLVGILVVSNVVGLLIQSIFYHVSKTYYHGGIDNSVV